jgi:hypothetical protein
MIVLELKGRSCVGKIVGQVGIILTDGDADECFLDKLTKRLNVNHSRRKRSKN